MNLKSMTACLLAILLFSCSRGEAGRPAARTSTDTVDSVAAAAVTPAPAEDRFILKSMHKIADNGGRAAWSPTGDDRIAFDRKDPGDRYYDLWVMNADGSNQVCLTRESPPGLPKRHVGNPSWHPSGKFILVNAEKERNPMVGNRLVEPYCEPGIGRNNDLWLISADGARAWRLWENPTPASLLAPQPALYNARFSHDGSRIAWTHSASGKGGAWGDYVIRVADFHLEPVPHIDTASMVEYDPLPGCNFKEVHGWVPGDTRLDVSGNWRGQHEFDQDLGAYDLATGRLVNLTPTPEQTWTEAVHTHPSGRKIVFMSSEGYALDFRNSNWWEWLKTDYWMMNADGTGAKRLTHFNEPGHAEYTGDVVNVAQFAWNPDGTKFCGVMNRTPPGGKGMLEIWVFELAEDGGPSTSSASTSSATAQPERIASIRIFQQSGARSRFSPDGGRIIFDRQNADGFFDLYVAGLHDPAPHSLSEGRPQLASRHNGNGAFHPSGRYIVFLSEEPSHFQDNLAWLGNPGLGMYCNLWAADPSGGKFWKLTNHPPKMKILDRIQAMSVVNPHFSHDGRRLIWTERYAAGGHHNWGKWRVMTAGFEEVDGSPRLVDPQVLLRAEDYGPNCNYVTAMGFLPGDTMLLLAGNLDGQHEYGMDQYLFDLSVRKLRNLVNTPEYWDEDAAVHPGGGFIVYMSNATSRFKLDFDNAQWATQPREREYWLLDLDKGIRERLTFFNDPQSPEYRGRRTIVAQPDFSPDGRYLAASMGQDRRDDGKADIELSLVLIEMAGSR